LEKRAEKPSKLEKDQTTKMEIVEDLKQEEKKLGEKQTHENIVGVGQKRGL